MATAGRILIMPKGTWNAETTYENLDMVAHSGRAWLAKKTSVGIEPSDANAEFWHDFLGMDVFTEENPPTAAQVGAVSLYADPVLSKSTDWDNLESGTYRFSTWGGSGGVGYPPIDDVGICILFDTEVGRYMYCLGMNRIVSRYYESKTWSDWIEGYLPLSGGTLSGNALGLCDGQSYLYDANDGYNVILEKWTDDKDSTKRRQLLLTNALGELRYALRVADFSMGNGSYYQIFGEHNKPSGSYTGNGSATERTIDIGGMDDPNPLLYIYSPQSGASALACRNHILCWNQDSSYVRSNAHGYFYSGTLKLTTTDSWLNANGYTYYWRVL